VPFIVDTNSRTQASIRFYNPDSTSFTVAVSGPIEVNSPHATLRAALSGIGIAVIPDFIARKPIEDGRLVTLFNDYLPTDRGIYAVYPHRRYLPAKVRVFVDYLHTWFRTHH
jgi:DNA-binding transcriptional LysR family regulator